MSLPHIDRLKLLITVLKEVGSGAWKPKDGYVAPAKFDLGTWNTGQGVHECGTSACAIGYAVLDPRIQAEGLYLDLSNFGLPLYMKQDHPSSPTGIQLRSWDAVSEFFEIEEGVALTLFSSFCYSRGWMADSLAETTLQDVIDRVQKLIDRCEELGRMPKTPYVEHLDEGYRAVYHNTKLHKLALEVPFKVPPRGCSLEIDAVLEDPTTTARQKYLALDDLVFNLPRKEPEAHG